MTDWHIHNSQNIKTQRIELEYDLPFEGCGGGMEIFEGLNCPQWYFMIQTVS